MYINVVHYTTWGGHLHPIVTHPGKVIHCVHKVSEYIQNCQLPHPLPSEYPNPSASALEYKRALARHFRHPLLGRKRPELSVVSCTGFLGEQKIKLKVSILTNKE